MANFIGNYLQHIMAVLLSDKTYDDISELYNLHYKEYVEEGKEKISVDALQKSQQSKSRGNLPSGIKPKDFCNRIIEEVYQDKKELKNFARRFHKTLEQDDIYPEDWSGHIDQISGFSECFSSDIFYSYILSLLEKDARTKKVGNNSKLSTLKQSEVALYRGGTESSKSSQPQKQKSCKIATFQELISLGYNAKTVANKLVENDYVNFESISIENEGTPQQWCEYLQNNNETFQYLLNYENEIVGNWSIVALNNECFEKAKRGELLEKDIDINKTEMIYYPGTYKGYILNFVLLPEYRTNDNYFLIVNFFLDQLEKYAENGIFFQSWCANAFSTAFEALVKSIGLKYQNDHKTFGKIYYCDFIPLPDIAAYKRREKLLTYYKEISN